MIKDSFWSGKHGLNNKIHEESRKMQAIDIKRVLIIEQTRRSDYEKI